MGSIEYKGPVLEASIKRHIEAATKQGKETFDTRDY